MLAALPAAKENIAPRHGRQEAGRQEATELKEVIARTRDGEVALSGNLVIARAGPTTWHPSKQAGPLRGEDVVIISQLYAAPPPGAAATATSAALLAAMVEKTPRRVELLAKHGKIAAGFADTYARTVDTGLTCALDVHCARALLAALTLAGGDGGSDRKAFPAVLVAARGSNDVCYLGQQRTEDGYTTFVVTSHNHSQEPRVEDLLREFERETGVSDDSNAIAARARGLYDLWDVDGCKRTEMTEPFVQLACEWALGRQHLQRAVGSPPLSVCSSLLFVGGTAPLSAAALALRADFAALQELQMLIESGGGGGGGSDGGATADAEVDGASVLDALLGRGSAEVHGRSAASQEAPGSSFAAAFSSSSPELQGTPDSHSSDSTNGASGAASPLRGVLDVTERLWPVLVAACRGRNGVEALEATLALVFEAVGEGSFFPAVAADNLTAIGRHLASGIEIAQASWRSFEDKASALDSGDESAEKRWYDAGRMLSAAATLAATQLGLLKVRRDLLHWFSTELALDEASELSWYVQGASCGLPEAAVLSEAIARADRLREVVEAVTLARVAGAPWEQARALASAALRKYCAASEDSEPAADLAFAVPLPEVLPLQARARCAAPLAWELQLTAHASGISRSYVSLKRGSLQPRAQGEPIDIDRAALKRAQAAAAAAAGGTKASPDCMAQVLFSLAGVKSLGELLQRQPRQQQEEELTEEPGMTLFSCTRRDIVCL